MTSRISPSVVNIVKRRNQYFNVNHVKVPCIVMNCVKEKGGRNTSKSASVSKL